MPQMTCCKCPKYLVQPFIINRAGLQPGKFGVLQPKRIKLDLKGLSPV